MLLVQHRLRVRRRHVPPTVFPGLLVLGYPGRRRALSTRPSVQLQLPPASIDHPAPALRASRLARPGPAPLRPNDRLACRAELQPGPALALGAGGLADGVHDEMDADADKQPLAPGRRAGGTATLVCHGIIPPLRPHERWCAQGSLQAPSPWKPPRELDDADTCQGHPSEDGQCLG